MNVSENHSSLAKEFHVLEGTKIFIVHEDIRYKSYVMWKGHFMSEKQQKIA